MKPPLLGIAMLAFLFTLPSGSTAAEPRRAPLPDHVAARLPDVLTPAPLDAVRLTGHLGERVRANVSGRLLRVDEDALLEGFRRRPGRQAWIGEHVGKWLHAATLAWASTGDPALRAKLDRVVVELLKTQEESGYLGTYIPDRRFGLYPNADWDVWVHKYCLIGLLTYHRYTGSEAALAASRRIGDLLIATFGPGKKSILAAGTHVGMASTSVLEPVVLLYRRTGDARYLAFARYLVNAWDEPRGPRIRTVLSTEGAVRKTGNAKAYEMLSNLVGLCELARATGERDLLKPCEAAWRDIVAHHLYLTGSASHHEHFHADHELPNGMSANVGETCVTVTWIQLNSQLLRLTGEARYAAELERSYFNHLMAAQRPDGSEWCYYTALEGTKPYGPGINCCVSSGPRGMALAPESLFYLGPGPDRFTIALPGSGQADLDLGGRPVRVDYDVNLPAGTSPGSVRLSLQAGGPVVFGARIRRPEWMAGLTVGRGPASRGVALSRDWIEIAPRRWKDGDYAELRFNVRPRLVRGEHGNAGRAAMTWGPYVLALDADQNPGLGSPRAVALAAGAEREAKPQATAARLLELSVPVTELGGRTRTARLVPFAEAGSEGGRYAVWLRAPGAPMPVDASLFLFAAESRSRPGNVTGEIADGDPSTYVVTFDARPAAEDWYAVELETPVDLARVVFAHGHCFHDGGWFDTSAGKPRVELRHSPGGAWEPAGVLADYPATTATDSAGLKDGAAFTLRLPAPIRAVAVRVIGRPASGDNPAQAFSSCAELSAFAR